MTCFPGWRPRIALVLPLVIVLAAPARTDATDPILRILVREAPSLELNAAAKGLRLSDARGQGIFILAPGQRLRLRAGDRGLIVAMPGSSLRPSSSGLSSSGLSGEAINQPLGKPAPQNALMGELPEIWVDSTEPGGLVSLGTARYRGRLRVVAAGERLQAINHIALESYLPSVVGSEMPAQWPLAALRAQAVAARTYAMAQRRPRQLFDLKANVSSQMYKGVEAETVSTRQAVAQTNGQVLFYQGRLIDAVFHSSSGGNTENSGEIWNRQLPYLTSVPAFDQISPLHSWSQFFTPQQLQRAFAEIGGVTAIEPLVTSTSGRIRQARVIGPDGQLLLSGAELRRRLGLRSTLVRFQLVASERPQATTLAVGPVSAAVAQATEGGGKPPGRFPGLRVPPPPPPPLDGLTVSRQVVGDTLGSRLGRGLPLLPPRLPLGGVGQSVPSLSLMAVGHGFGHGVGMSQWGAYGMALRGKSHAEILRHYYQGAELGLGSL